MNQDPFAKKRHLEFLKTVVKKKKVYSIDNEEGIASASIEQSDSDLATANELLFFWSEKRLAQVHCLGEWADYTPKEISLADFLENWCIGMHSDKMLVGTNFDKDLIGYELAPLELVLGILTKLKKAGDSLSFSRYESMAEFEVLVREHLAEG